MPRENKDYDGNITQNTEIFWWNDGNLTVWINVIIKEKE